MVISWNKGVRTVTAQEQTYILWVDWEHHVASLHPAEGFEEIRCFSQENYQANLRILTQSGFRFQ